MENKRKNIYITIFVITTIIASCLAVYFAILANNNVKEVQNSKVDNTVSSSSTENSAQTSDLKEEQKVEKITVTTVPPRMDPNKCLNKDEGVTYFENTGDEFGGITCSLNTIKTSVNIDIDIDKVKSTYGLDIDKSNEMMSIANFNENVADVKISSLGFQAVGYEVMLFLMEDGTVEYMPIYNALKENKIMSYGKIQGIKDIVKITDGYVRGNEGGGGGFPVAIKSDGSFYNLEKYLRDAVNPKW